MPKKTVDLDAFLAERESNGTEIKFRGKTYAVPPEIPWTAFEKAQQMQEQEVSVEQIGEVVSLVIGRESWNEMLADGIGFNTGMLVLNAIMDVMMDSVPEEAKDDPKVREAMQRASVSASRTPQESSDSSRQTSSGSIKLVPLSSAV